MPSSCSISSHSSKGSRASRSILLMKVKIGMSRMTQTLNSLRVWASTPLAASMTMTARVGGHQGAVGVLGEVLVARGVQNVDAEALVLELHDRRGDGDAALLFNLHPVGGGVRGRFSCL